MNIELKTANVLASELANENLQLRQAVIRLRFELEEARAASAEDEPS